jgi:hypothetical protein
MGHPQKPLKQNRLVDGGAELEGGEELVVAGGVEGREEEGVAVDGDVVDVPEIYVGEIVGDDLLDLLKDLSAFVMVGSLAGLVEEHVELGVAIAAAIGAVGRNFVGGEDEFENVGVVVSADPALCVELEGAVSDVGVEGGEFLGANFESDAELLPLLLEDFGVEASGFVGGSLKSEAKADAAGAASEAGRVKERGGARGIVIVVGEIGIEGPVGGREERRGEAGLAAEEVADDGGAVSGVGEALADGTLGEDGVFKVESDVGEGGAGLIVGGNVRIAAKGVDHVGSEGSEFDVGGAFAEFESAHGGVGNDAEVYAGDVRRGAEVVGIAFEEDVEIGSGGDETEGAGAHRSGGDGGRGGVARDNADGGAREIPEEGSVGFAEMDLNGVGIGRGDRVDHAEGGALRSFEGAADDGVESEEHVGGGERCAIGEGDVVAEMEDVSERVGSVPGFGEVGRGIHLGVAGDEGGEEEVVDVLGPSVGADARVEVGGGIFDQEIYGAGIFVGGDGSGVGGAGVKESGREESEGE